MQLTVQCNVYMFFFSFMTHFLTDVTYATVVVKGPWISCGSRSRSELGLMSPPHSPLCWVLASRGHCSSLDLLPGSYFDHGFGQLWCWRHCHSSGRWSVLLAFSLCSSGAAVKRFRWSLFMPLAYAATSLADFVGRSSKDRSRNWSSLPDGFHFEVCRSCNDQQCSAHLESTPTLWLKWTSGFLPLCLQPRTKSTLEKTPAIARWKENPGYADYVVQAATFATRSPCYVPECIVSVTWPVLDRCSGPHSLLRARLSSYITLWGFWNRLLVLLHHHFLEARPKQHLPVLHPPLETWNISNQWSLTQTWCCLLLWSFLSHFSSSALWVWVCVCNWCLAAALSCLAERLLVIGWLHLRRASNEVCGWQLSAVH